MEYIFSKVYGDGKGYGIGDGESYGYGDGDGGGYGNGYGYGNGDGDASITCGTSSKRPCFYVIVARGRKAAGNPHQCERF